MKTSEFLQRMREREIVVLGENGSFYLYEQPFSLKNMYFARVSNIELSGFQILPDNIKKLTKEVAQDIIDYSYTPLDEREEQKKYNVVAWNNDEKPEFQSMYWFRSYKGNPDTAVSSENDDDSQQRTLDQIKEYGLEDFERVEVDE